MTKVWEYLRDIKAPQATRDQVLSWMRMNKVTPCNVEDNLEIDYPLPASIKSVIKSVCIENEKCGDCIEKFLDCEVKV